jgi:hypothetical protein
MTAIWGPMGWMTLHSISLNYPENPSPADKSIVTKFLELFAETISCPSCKNHFTNMFKSYIVNNRGWNSSRNELFVFIARAHNTVNRRLDKPVQSTVNDCIAAIKINSQKTSLFEFRRSYLNYLMSNWGREGGGEGFIQMRNVQEMMKINMQYWNLRDVSINTITIPESDVLQNIAPVSKFTSPFSQQAIYTNSPINVGFSLKFGKFSLRH